MQSQRRILGVKWYGKITNTARSKGDNRANRSTFHHRRSTSLTFWSHLPIIQGYTCFTSITSIHLRLTGTPPATDWKRQPGSPQRTCFNQWKKILVYPVNSQPWTARCGDRYDPQPVMVRVPGSIPGTQSYKFFLCRFW